MRWKSLCGAILRAPLCGAKNNIRDVGSTADLVLVLLVHLVHWYLVHGLIGTSGALVPGTLVPTVT